MSMTDNALERHEGRRLMLWKHDLMKISWNSWERFIGRRLNICISLLARQRKKKFLWKIVTGDEK
uniref:Ovule protein n=1 Tax=Heterorhabditis bacteriophora TaxID=37862 RepID=A0A1I7W6V4_HETBA